jgi:hypothetical protein
MISPSFCIGLHAVNFLLYDTILFESRAEYTIVLMACSLLICNCPYDCTLEIPDTYYFELWNTL